MKKKELIIYVCTVVLSVVFIFAGYKITSSKSVFVAKSDVGAVKAKVVSIVDTSEDIVSFGEDSYAESYTNRIITFTAKLLSGEKKGQTVSAVQTIDSMYLIQQNEVKPGDKIILVTNFDDTIEEEMMFSQFIRTDAMTVLAIIFCLLLLVFGRMKGANTLISLVFTCAAVFFVFIPSVLASMNIYFWSILICIFITVMTLLLVNGANFKSLAAGIGCVSGVFVAGALMKFMDIFLRLTGETDEHSIYLSQLNPDDPIDLKALIFAMIIIGAVGAIMDVAMSMASSLHELHEKNPTLTAVSLFRSGMTIGRDIMGTMANTLVLAYIGSSLCTVLLLFVYDASFMEIMNKELIVVEILQALVGSFGIMFAIPFTAFVASVFYTRGINASSGVKNKGVSHREKVEAEMKRDKAYGSGDYYDSLFPTERSRKNTDAPQKLSDNADDYLNSLY